MKFRKKPVVIEAVQFLGTGQSCDEVTAFFGGETSQNHRWKLCTLDGGYIPTLEGVMEFGVSDWIIKGVKGEFYPCKPYIFEVTYDPA